MERCKIEYLLGYDVKLIINLLGKECVLNIFGFIK